jgi:hypothetical protein
MQVKAASDLTLRDRLSRLTYQQVVKRLGPDGAALLHSGGAYEIDIDNQVDFGSKHLSLSLGDRVSVTLFLSDTASRRIDWQCFCGESRCEHAGAAFSLILEGKTALGLAKEPGELTAKLRKSLEDCIVPDDQGGYQLTVKFRGKEALDKLAQSMAGLLALSDTQ